MAKGVNILGLDFDEKTVKIVMRSVGVLILLVVLIFIILKVKGSFIKEMKSQNAIKDANKEIDINQLTLTEAQYNTLSSKFYRAVKGLGTDNKAVYAVFEALNTRSDLMKLMAVFGVQKDLTLAEWLHDDLNQKEIDHVNNILAAKSIDYKF